MFSYYFLNYAHSATIPCGFTSGKLTHPIWTQGPLRPKGWGLLPASLKTSIHPAAWGFQGKDSGNCLTWVHFIVTSLRMLIRP